MEAKAGTTKSTDADAILGVILLAKSEWMLWRHCFSRPWGAAPLLGADAPWRSNSAPSFKKCLVKPSILFGVNCPERPYSRCGHRWHGGTLEVWSHPLHPHGSARAHIVSWRESNPVPSSCEVMTLPTDPAFLTALHPQHSMPKVNASFFCSKSLVL